MIEPIVFDTRAITEQFSLNKAQVDGMMGFVVKEVTAAFAREWESQANKNLKRTRKRYIDSLSVVDEGRLSGSVVLNWANDEMVGFLEEGVGAFDMKPNFAKSNKKKTKKNGKGWYLTIPFRVATPDAIGESDLFAFKMNEAVYETVKQKEQTIPVSGGGMSAYDIPDQFQAPTMRAAVSNLSENKTFDEYQRKSSIYQGLSKVQDPKTQQNIYMNFRRVSDNSDPNSWIHPGINAYNLADKAMDEFRPEMPFEVNAGINQALSKLL